MATGVKITTGAEGYFYGPYHGASAPDGLSWSAGPRTLYDTVEYPHVGPMTNRLPSSPTTYGTAPGVRIATYSDDYHNTIHVTPQFVDVGSVVASTIRYVEVWNGYLKESKTLDAITADVVDEGISVAGVTLPYTFAPLQSVVLTVTVTDDGPATIDSRYDLVFTTAEGTPFFRVTGRRTVEWPEAPNWSSAYEETLAYKTEVLTAFNGDEQRIALRHWPRRLLSFDTLQDRDRDRTFRRRLATWQPRYFVMPDWARGAASQGAPVGSLTITLDEPAPEIVAESLVSLRHGDLAQTLEVASVSGSTLTLASPLAYTFPVGTRVYPVLTVHAPTEIATRRTTSTVASAAVTLQQAPRRGKLVPAAAPVTWRGLEVFLTKPNWADPLAATHRFDFAMLDSGRGTFEYRAPFDAPKDRQKLTFLLEGRAAVRDIEQFFYRCRGRRGEFYMPTWSVDIVVPPGAFLFEGSIQLRVDNAEEVSRQDTETVYRNLYVRLRDGTTFLRQINGATSGPSGDYLVLDLEWPYTIAAEDILAIHFLPRWRLAGDEITFVWHTDTVAEVTLAPQTLKDV